MSNNYMSIPNNTSILKNSTMLAPTNTSTPASLPKNDDNDDNNNDNNDTSKDKDTNILVVCDNNNNTGKYIYIIFHIIMSFVAVYLSWKCNGKFNLLSFIIALLFPYVYIIYILASKGTCDRII